jgi:hypothetical protein
MTLKEAKEARLNDITLMKDALKHYAEFLRAEAHRTVSATNNFNDPHAVLIRRKADRVAHLSEQPYRS